MYFRKSNTFNQKRQTSLQSIIMSKNYSPGKLAMTCVQVFYLYREFHITASYHVLNFEINKFYLQNELKVIFL